MDPHNKASEWQGWDRPHHNTEPLALFVFTLGSMLSVTKM